MDLLGGRYEVERRIGEGGMAEVLLARDTQAGNQQVVIKRCRAHLKHQPEFATLFLREARLASLVQHENVVKVDGTGEDDGQPYLVMEYLQGFTVRDIYLRATTEGALPQDVVAAIVLGAARGLSAAHTAVDERGMPIGLVHRDVSPHNLFLTDHGIVKVLDFGIAKGANDVTMTRAGHVKGKASYLAPEQLKQPTKIDARTDLFSLGTVAWELFTARRLFRRATETDTINAIRTLTVPDPRTLRPELDPEYAAVVLRLLARRPEDRPANAAEVAAAFETALSRRAPKLDSHDLSRFVSHVREIAPIDEQGPSSVPSNAPVDKAARRAEFDEAWGADAPTQALPRARSSRPPPMPAPAPSSAPPTEEPTATVAPPTASWTSATGEQASADGSVVGTWAVAGAPRQGTADSSGGFAGLDPSDLVLESSKAERLPFFPGSPPPAPDTSSGPFALSPRHAPHMPGATASPYPPWLDQLLRARPQPAVIVGILLASLLAGIVVAFVITKIFS